MKKKINILLIEDNPADAKFVDVQLKKAFGDSYVLHTTEYFMKASQLCQQTAYDIILLDLNLPDSKGLESLKKLIKICKKPIIVYTGISDKLIIDEVIGSGAVDFLIKGQTSSQILKQSITRNMNA